MMRQAGRFMKEYWDIKNRYSFLEMCKTPEIAADVTMLPVDLLGVDAAILFSDILVPPDPAGLLDDRVLGRDPVRLGVDEGAVHVPEDGGGQVGHVGRVYVGLHTLPTTGP